VQIIFCLRLTLSYLLEQRNEDDKTKKQIAETEISELQSVVVW